MTAQSRETIAGALSKWASMLEADGYAMSVVSADPSGILLRIDAGADACADCLVPPSMMEMYVRDALKDLPDWAAAPIAFRYPETEQ